MLMLANPYPKDVPKEKKKVLKVKPMTSRERKKAKLFHVSGKGNFARENGHIGFTMS